MRETTRLLLRLDELADDIGRLRRRTDPDSYDHHLLDRLASHVQTISTLLEPTAAELAAQTYPGDNDIARIAIQEVDNRARRLNERLGV